MIGTCVGLLLGFGHCRQHRRDRPGHERALNASFLPKDIYLISKMPATAGRRHRAIGVISLVLAFVAAAVSQLACQPCQSGRGSSL